MFLSFNCDSDHLLFCFKGSVWLLQSGVDYLLTEVTHAVDTSQAVWEHTNICSSVAVASQFSCNCHHAIISIVNNIFIVCGCNEGRGSDSNISGQEVERRKCFAGYVSEWQQAIKWI